MQVLGITGHIGAGKDTTALLAMDIWTKRFGAGSVSTLSFSDTLIAEVAEAFKLPNENLFRDRSLKERDSYQLTMECCSDTGFRQYMMLSRHVKYLDPISPRNALRCWGAYRRKTYPKYFVGAMAARVRMAESLGQLLVIIPDVRLAIEAAFVAEKKGVIWRVEREGLAAASADVTDTEQADIEALQLSNTGDMDTLRLRVADALEPLAGAALDLLVAYADQAEGKA